MVPATGRPCLIGTDVTGLVRWLSWWAKVLAKKAYNLSSIPRTYVKVGGEREHLKVVL